MHKKCAKIRKANNENSAGYVFSLSCLAEVYKIIGDYHKAALYMKRCLQIIQSLEPKNENIEIYNLQRKA